MDTSLVWRSSSPRGVALHETPLLAADPAFVPDGVSERQRAVVEGVILGRPTTNALQTFVVALEKLEEPRRRGVTPLDESRSEGRPSRQPNALLTYNVPLLDQNGRMVTALSVVLTFE